MITRRSTLILALLTLLLMGGGGIALIWFREEGETISYLSGYVSVLYQIIAGLAAGMLGAYVAWWIVSLDYLANTRTFFVELFRGLQLGVSEIVFISFCAGIGEELLFRGGIQPILGIWITAILFVALHGYLNPAKRPLMVYGIFMVFVIAGFGYMTEHIGIISAMVAHTVLDIYLIMKLVRN